MEKTEVTETIRVWLKDNGYDNGSNCSNSPVMHGNKNRSLSTLHSDGMPANSVYLFCQPKVEDILRNIVITSDTVSIYVIQEPYNYHRWSEVSTREYTTQDQLKEVLDELLQKDKPKAEAWG